jgi:hypothetical protein
MLVGGSLWDYLHSPAVRYAWLTALEMAMDVAAGIGERASERFLWLPVRFTPHIYVR